MAATTRKIDYLKEHDGPTEEWVHLRHNKWNGNANGCWRLDLDYESAADD